MHRDAAIVIPFGLTFAIFPPRRPFIFPSRSSFIASFIASFIVSPSVKHFRLPFTAIGAHSFPPFRLLFPIRFFDLTGFLLHLLSRGGKFRIKRYPNIRTIDNKSTADNRTLKMRKGFSQLIESFPQA